MMLVRQTFQAKYGRGDELVALFKEFHENAEVPNRATARILTDASGPFFTVVTEYTVENFAEWETAFAKLMGGPQMAEWFGRMTEVTESGRRDFYNIVS
ncbi:MAG: hypothetical protein AB7I38_09630 [Dehalococcoidia bacterium]